MKQPKENKARAVQPGRPKKQACPICGVLYAPGVGLASHIRFKHANAPQALPVASNKVSAPEEGAIRVVPIIDPKTHLQEAIDQLTARKSQIDQELGRAEGLQTESREVNKRIEALHTAMRAFGQESMAASG
jgi:hypothetical protein